MTRKDIIDFLKSKKVEFNPTLKLNDLEKLYKLHSEEKSEQNPSEETTSEPAPNGESKSKPKSEMQQVLDMMGTVLGKVEQLDGRLTKVEGPNGSEFKNDAKAADVEVANRMKEDLDPRVVKIVEETLGIDFGVELQTFEDRPGFLFTVVVPNRLSDMPPSTRPVINSETGKYKVQEDGKTPVLEDYIPQDRRSRSIGSSQSYDAIRDHCNKVRAYIVSYYTKLSKPIPEFKIKG